MPEVPEATGYRIIRLTQHHITDIESLYLAVYEKKPPPGYFLKKYDTSYTGTSFIGYLAINTAETVIGFYAVIPCYLSWQNEPVLAAQSADTMTHPHFRYKGLFVELSLLCFELCRQQGIRIIFGFPNQNSLHGAIHKLHWTQAGMMDCFTIPVRTLPIRQMTTRVPALKKMFERYADYLLKKIASAEGIENKIMQEGFAGILRNEAFLTYKNYQPRRTIWLGDAVVWIKLQQALVVGDFILNAMPAEVFINQLISLARRLGLSAIQMQFSRGTAMHHWLAARFPADPSFPVLCMDFGSGIPADKLKFSFADIDIF